jgi:hypothetical protein
MTTMKMMMVIIKMVMVKIMRRRRRKKKMMMMIMKMRKLALLLFATRTHSQPLFHHRREHALSLMVKTLPFLFVLRNSAMKVTLEAMI